MVNVRRRALNESEEYSDVPDQTIKGSSLEIELLSISI
jgi:hypothetical protein